MCTPFFSIVRGRGRDLTEETGLNTLENETARKLILRNHRGAEGEQAGLLRDLLQRDPKAIYQ